MSEDERVARVLLRAADLVDAGWTRRVFALNRHGLRVEITSPEACRFCVDGAIRRAVWEFSEVSMESKPTDQFWRGAQRRLRGFIGMGVVEWNDEQVDAACVSAKLRELAERLTGASS